MKILVVDDNATDLKLLQIVLESRGYDVDIATSGQECLRKFRANPDDFSLIFMDVRMPGIDGIEVTERLRRLSDVPIYAVTSHSEPAVKRACQAAGMNGHIPKPFGLDAIVSIVEKSIGKPRQGP